MADFGLGSPTSEYVKGANREMLVCVLIEDVAAVDNLDEILGVPDIDVFFIGSTDLAQSMGHPRATTDTRTSRRSCRTCSTGFTRPVTPLGRRALQNRRARPPRQASCTTTPTFQLS